MSNTRNLPSKELPSGLQAVPNSLTDFATVEAYIMQISVTNTTNSTITLTVQDKQGSPKVLLSAINIDPNAPAIFVWPEGVRMIGGISWQASGAGLNAEIFGFQFGV